MTSTRLSRGIAAAALLAGLALGGCSAQPGAAAVVDGQRISEGELSRTVSDFSAVVGQPVEARQLLGTLIVAPMILDVAADYGVAASDDEAAQLLDAQLEASGQTAPEEGYSDGLLQVAKVVIVNQEMSMAPDATIAVEEVNTRIAEADIEVSPRYGEFDPTTGEVLADELPWIVSGQ